MVVRPIPFQKEGNNISIKVDIKYPRITGGPLIWVKARKSKKAMTTLMKEFKDTFRYLEEFKKEEELL